MEKKEETVQASETAVESAKVGGGKLPEEQGGRVENPSHVADPARLAGESEAAYGHFVRWVKFGQQLSQREVGELLELAQPHICRLMKKYRWEARAKEYNGARGLGDEAMKLAMKRQEDVKEQERDLSLLLLEQGAAALRRFGTDGRAPSGGEIVKLIELGTRLARLSSGLPLSHTELSSDPLRPVRVELEVALNRVYGEMARKARAPLPAIEVEVASEAVGEGGNQ
jgi:hypothetical protein